MDLEEFLQSLPFDPYDSDFAEFRHEAIRGASKLQKELRDYKSTCLLFKRYLEEIDEYARGGFMKETDEIGALYNIRQMCLGALGIEE